MWSGECETSKYGSFTIYQRQNIYTTYITIGVIAFILICGPVVFIWIQRSKAAIGGNIDYNVNVQINQLDQWDTTSKITQAVDSSDGTTK